MHLFLSVNLTLVVKSFFKASFLPIILCTNTRKPAVVFFSSIMFCEDLFAERFQFVQDIYLAINSCHLLFRIALVMS